MIDQIDTRKILKSLKKDLEVLWKAHDRVENEFKEFVATLDEHRSIEYKYNSTYIIWVYFSLSREDHLAYLKERFETDATIVPRTYDVAGVYDFNPEAGPLSEDALTFSDGINLYFKHLQGAVDLEPPRQIIQLPTIGYQYDVSILDTSGQFSDFRKATEVYLIRVASILKKIDASSLDAPANYNDKPWEYWKELVSDGKVNSVIKLMKTHFQETGKSDYHDEVIVLSSRFSNYEQVMHQGIRPPETLGLEHQIIVQAIMHLINSYKKEIESL